MKPQDQSASENTPSGKGIAEQKRSNMLNTLLKFFGIRLDEEQSSTKELAPVSSVASTTISAPEHSTPAVSAEPVPAAQENTATPSFPDTTESSTAVSSNDTTATSADTASDAATTTESAANADTTQDSLPEAEVSTEQSSTAATSLGDDSPQTTSPEMTAPPAADDDTNEVGADAHSTASTTESSTAPTATSAENNTADTDPITAALTASTSEPSNSDQAEDSTGSVTESTDASDATAAHDASAVAALEDTVSTEPETAAPTSDSSANSAAATTASENSMAEDSSAAPAEADTSLESTAQDSTTNDADKGAIEALGTSATAADNDAALPVDSATTTEAASAADNSHTASTTSDNEAEEAAANAEDNNSTTANDAADSTQESTAITTEEAAPHSEVDADATSPAATADASLASTVVTEPAESVDTTAPSAATPEASEVAATFEEEGVTAPAAASADSTLEAHDTTESAAVNAAAATDNGDASATQESTQQTVAVTVSENTPDSTAAEGLSNAERTLPIATTLNAAKELFGRGQSVALNTKDHLEALFTQEDQILGERYHLGTISSYALFAIEEMLYGVLPSSNECRESNILELLQVLACQNPEEPLSAEGSSEHGGFAFTKTRNLLLRRILFNNVSLNTIAQSEGSDEDKWQQWQQQFIASNQPPAPKRGRVSGASGDDTDDDDAIESGSNLEALWQQDLVPETFTRLAQVFHHKFSDFAKAVNLLRNWAINLEDDKLWQSKLLFPFGYSALFWGLQQSLKIENKQMSGAGQLVFTFLARAYAHDHANASATTSATAAPAESAPSATTAALNESQEQSHTDTVGTVLVERFFQAPDPLNVLAHALGQSKHTEHEQSAIRELQQLHTYNERRNTSRVLAFVNTTRFVPYKYLPLYSVAYEDYSHLLALNLTKQDLFLALGTMGQLHVMVYLLEVSQKVGLLLGKKHNIDMVVVADKLSKDKLRDLSMDRLRANTHLHLDLSAPYIRQHLRAFITSTAPFLLERKRLTIEEQKLLCNLIRACFSFSPSMVIDLEHMTIVDSASTGNGATKDASVSATADDRPEESSRWLNVPQSSAPYRSYQQVEDLIVEAAAQRHKHHESMHSSFGKDIGLISRDYARTFYYALSDELLRTLIMTLVDPAQPMMLSEFLELLYQRYHLVLAPAQAQYYVQSDRSEPYHVDDKEFDKNLKALKSQLIRLDLLISLSDYCDYVRNPYRR